MAMLIALTFTVLFRSIYFCIKAYDVAQLNEIDPEEGSEDKPLTMMSALPVVFLQITVIINLSNWVFYYFKIIE